MRVEPLELRKELDALEVEMARYLKALIQQLLTDKRRVAL